MNSEIWNLSTNAWPVMQIVYNRILAGNGYVSKQIQAELNASLHPSWSIC